MAITIIVMARMKKFKIFGKSYFVSQGFIVILTIANRIKSTTTINIADASANFPISLAKVSNFC